jgi:secreted trypsin-like serine protease
MTYRLIYLKWITIHFRWVLTAAHCVKFYENRPEMIKIVAGDNNVRKKEPEEQHVNVCNVYNHPKYTKKPRILHDISLLKLCKDVKFTPFIQPIAVGRTVPNSGTVTVAGWGNTEEGGVGSSILKKVHLRIDRTLGCKHLPKSQICAGVMKGGHGSCQGDSGGPLSYVSNRKPYQIGVVSHGVGCARPKRPTVYTNVAYYRSWIVETMRKREDTLYQPPINSTLQTTL